VSNDQPVRDGSSSGARGLRPDATAAPAAAQALRARSRYRAPMAALLVVAVAAAGITLNFALLGLTSENSDPVGRLSPRAIFDTPAGTTEQTGSETTPGALTIDGVRTITRGASDDRTHAYEDDDDD
jgi:hypothetical protein